MVCLESYLWIPNSRENFSVLVLLMEVSKRWKIVELKWKMFKTFYDAQAASCLKEIIQFPTR